MVTNFLTNFLTISLRSQSGDTNLIFAAIDVHEKKTRLVFFLTTLKKSYLPGKIVFRPKTLLRKKLKPAKKNLDTYFHITAALAWRARHDVYAW